MEIPALFQLRRMSRLFQNLEAGASDAVTHLDTVLRCARPVVTTLDYQGRHLDEFVGIFLPFEIPERRKGDDEDPSLT